MEKELFEAVLGIVEPVYVNKIIFDESAGELHIHMDFRSGGRFCCPECGAEGLPVHDTVEKTWRHLNFFQYRCYIHFRAPRVSCSKCGTRLWRAPWARERSGFTLLFEALAVELAKGMPVSRIGKLVGEHDTRIWRIIRGYVDRAYAEKTFAQVSKVGIDETSSRKGHKYVTIFADMKSGKVIYAVEGKDSKTIGNFASELPKHGASASGIKEITMDMSSAFIAGAAKEMPNAEITFDKFHVIQTLNKAQDEARGTEQKQNPLLNKTRYIWLKNPANLSAEQKKKFETLKNENLKTAKVYQMKLTFQDIYRNITDARAAELAIKKWLSWAARSRIDSIKQFAKTVKAHWNGILQYFTSRLTSGAMEGINSRIQGIKRRARGFRNMKNFIAMIYLETADLYFPLPT